MKYKRLTYPYFNNVLYNIIDSEVVASFMGNTSFLFTFEDYVKSQIHFPMVYALGSDRTLEDFANTYLLITRNDISTTNESSMRKVLKFFYDDIFNCSKILKMKNSDFDFAVDSDLQNHLLECEECSEESFELKLMALLDASEKCKYVKVGEF
jgi:hypothetical protein